jgi:hypothetical protein
MYKFRDLVPSQMLVHMDRNKESIHRNTSLHALITFTFLSRSYYVLITLAFCAVIGETKMNRRSQANIWEIGKMFQNVNTAVTNVKEMYKTFY